MTDSVVVLRARLVHELLRLARELALQLDADAADDTDLVEVQLLRAVERVESEFTEEERPTERDVRDLLHRALRSER